MSNNCNDVLLEKINNMLNNFKEMKEDNNKAHADIVEMFKTFKTEIKVKNAKYEEDIRELQEYKIKSKQTVVVLFTLFTLFFSSVSAGLFFLIRVVNENQRMNFENIVEFKIRQNREETKNEIDKTITEYIEKIN